MVNPSPRGFLKPKHPKVQAPEQPADPYADLYGYVTPPETTGLRGFVDQMKYINRTSPGAFMQLAGGLMGGDTAGGISNAGQELAASTEQQRRAQLGLYKHQEGEKAKNLTRQWLIGQGISPEDAEAAMANPAILSELLAPPDKRNLIEVDGKLYDADTGEWITPGGGAAGGLDLGNSIEGRALKFLVDQGKLTEEQAAEVAAGKVVTNPADGSQWFMTPQGLVGRDAAGNPIDPNAAAPAGGTAGQAADGGGVVGGRQVTPAKPVTGTEGERRAQLLYGPTKLQEKIALDNYDALSSKMGLAARLGEQLPGVGGVVKTLSDYVTTPEYQQARNAVKAIYTNWLYATSGATIPDSEQETQADLLMPRPGEDAASVENKKQRLKDYVEGIRIAQGVLAGKEDGGPSQKPAAIPQATWDAMTDEEKAQF